MLKLSLTEFLTIQEPKPCCSRYALSTLLASWYGFAILYKGGKNRKNKSFRKEENKLSNKPFLWHKRADLIKKWE